MKSGAVLLALFGLAVCASAQDSCQYQYTFTTVGQQAYLRSPAWSASYPPNSNCKYTLSSPTGTRIALNCTEFNVEYASGCVYDAFVMSLSGDSTLRDGMKACGQGKFEQTSNANALVVGFTSDSSNPASNSVYRFQCMITIVGSTPTAAAVTSAPATKAPVTQAPVTQAPATAAAAGTPTCDGTCSCGTRNEAQRIVGGVDAGVNEFPWRVALYSPNMGVFCGGTIISANWVMTAAHCTAALKSTDELYIDAGDHDLRVTTEATNQLIKCDRIVQHASYNNDTQDNDMALCHLSTPLTFSRTIQPICLPWSMAGQTFQGKTVTASGWGTTSSGGSASSVLQKVDLPVKTTEECRQYYGTAITNNMICTYSAGKDTCQGDSGGSIDLKDATCGRYYAIGVVSWGVGCAGVNQPGVYAKVPNYLQWISTTTNENFCK